MASTWKGWRPGSSPSAAESAPERVSSGRYARDYPAMRSSTLRRNHARFRRSSAFCSRAVDGTTTGKCRILLLYCSAGSKNLLTACMLRRDTRRTMPPALRDRARSVATSCTAIPEGAHEAQTTRRLTHPGGVPGPHPGQPPRTPGRARARQHPARLHLWPFWLLRTRNPEVGLYIGGSVEARDVRNRTGRGGGIAAGPAGGRGDARIDPHVFHDRRRARHHP